MIKVFKLIPAQLYPPLILSAFSLSLLSARFVYMGSGRFVFMAWNLMLAWLPMLWAALLVRSIKSSRWLSLASIVYGFLWLSFLPNSFYMVTDLIHLHTSSTGSLLFDAVMLMAFGLTGILLGCMSVYMVHQPLMKRYKFKTSWLIMLVIFAMSGLAIYMGRDLGWNSWDLVANPLYIIFDLANRLANNEKILNVFGITLLFFALITSCYTAFYTGLKAVKRRK